MASLREMVSQYKEELRDGIAWLVFWEEGCSWKAEYFYLEPSEDTLLPEDKEMLEKVQALDPAAVVLNGYYCGYLAEDMSITRLASGVLCHYENGYNKVADFIQSHEHSLQEKQAEVTKEAARIQENKEPINFVDHHKRKENKPMLSVTIPKDKKRLEQSIAALEWQLEQEGSEKDKEIYRKTLEAYQMALMDYHRKVQLEKQPLSAIS